MLLKKLLQKNYCLLKSCLHWLYLDKIMTQLLNLVFVFTPAANLVTTNFWTAKFKSQSEEFNSQQDEFICWKDKFICLRDKINCQKDEFNCQTCISDIDISHAILHWTVHYIVALHKTRDFSKGFLGICYIHHYDCSVRVVCLCYSCPPLTQMKRSNTHHVQMRLSTVNVIEIIASCFQLCWACYNSIQMPLVGVENTNDWTLYWEAEMHNIFTLSLKEMEHNNKSMMCTCNTALC